MSHRTFSAVLSGFVIGCLLTPVPAQASARDRAIREGAAYIWRGVTKKTPTVVKPNFAGYVQRRCLIATYDTDPSTKCP